MKDLPIGCRRKAGFSDDDEMSQNLGASKLAPREASVYWERSSCSPPSIFEIIANLLRNCSQATRVAYAPIANEPVDLGVSILPELPHTFSSGFILGNQTGIDHFRSAVMFNKTIPTGNNGTAPNNVQYVDESWMYAVQGPWQVLPGTTHLQDISCHVLGDARHKLTCTQMCYRYRNDAISGAVHGCPPGKQCKLNVTAPALTRTACTTHEVPVDYFQYASLASVTSYEHGASLDRVMFMIDISLLVDQKKEAINVITGAVSPMKHCAGTFSYTACTLEAVCKAPGL